MEAAGSLRSPAAFLMLRRSRIAGVSQPHLASMTSPAPCLATPLWSPSGRRFLLGAAFALVASARAGAAQGTTLRISGTPTCDSCRIEVNRIFSVGRIPGAVPGLDSHIARDSAGRYLVVVEPGPRVAVLDSVGRFVEFLNWRPKPAGTPTRNVRVRVDRDGNPNVYDGLSWTRFDSDGVSRVGVLDEYLVLGTGPMGFPVAITRPLAAPHRSFATLHLRVDSSDAGPFSPVTPAASRPATRADQFAADSVISNPSCRGCTDLVLDVAFGFEKGVVWTATTDRYRMDLFHGWGKRLTQSVEIADSWLPLRSPMAYAPGRTLPEGPRLTALVFDRNVCTYSSGPAPTALPRDTPCERYLWISGLTVADSSAIDERQRYSTVIDVVGVTASFVPEPYDPQPLKGARVIARFRFAGRLEMFGPGLAYERRQLSDGSQSTNVYRLELKSR